jgi:hypothetical protein
MLEIYHRLLPGGGGGGPFGLVVVLRMEQWKAEITPVLWVH